MVHDAVPGGGRFYESADPKCCIWDRGALHYNFATHDLFEIRAPDVNLRDAQCLSGRSRSRDGRAGNPPVGPGLPAHRQVARRTGHAHCGERRAGTPQVTKASGASYYRTHYGVAITADNVMILAGGRPALVAVLYFLTRRIAVRVASPEYTPYFDLLERLGRTWSMVPSNQQNRFTPAIADYLGAGDGKRSLVLMSNPCNPTGITRQGAELQQLVPAASSNGAGWWPRSGTSRSSVTSPRLPWAAFLIPRRVTRSSSLGKIASPWPGRPCPPSTAGSARDKQRRSSGSASTSSRATADSTTGAACLQAWVLVSRPVPRPDRVRTEPALVQARGRDPQGGRIATWPGAVMRLRCVASSASHSAPSSPSRSIRTSPY